MRRGKVVAVGLGFLTVTIMALGAVGWGVQEAVHALDPGQSAAATAADIEALNIGALNIGPAPHLEPVRLSYTRPASIPVLVYHELDNGCAAVSLQCNGNDVESSSERQFAENLSWLYDHGFQTVTAAQYAAWVRGERVALPSKPVFLTADNGISSMFTGATPLLQRFGFTMTAMVVSGFADGASGDCEPPEVMTSVGLVSAQPGCGKDNKNWDMTWQQLQALPASIWSFALEAGPSGHFVQDYNPACRVFLACKEPGETTAEYEQRVAAELSSGEAELRSHLGARASTAMWTVPYSDLGYRRCKQADCTPQPTTGPPGWLAAYAARSYPIVFVEDAYRNGIEHDRFRFDVQGWMTQHYFVSALTADIQDGDFAFYHEATATRSRSGGSANT